MPRANAPETINKGGFVMTEIYIESRNEDGKRLVHRFESREALLKDLHSEDPSMGG